MTINIDTLLSNAIVLTMDEKLTQYEPGAVAVNDGEILNVGLEKTLKGKYEPSEHIDCRGKVLMPGLINAHTHVPMTLMRGLADDLRLDVWLLGFMMPVEREFVDPEFVRLGTQIACLEQIKSGITCFVDMYYFEDYVAKATAEIGMRAICSQTVLKFHAPDAAFYEESLAVARDYIQRWVGHELIVPSIAPHAPYTCTEEILHASTKLALEFDVPLCTHFAETAQEVENSRELYGMPVIPYAKKHHLLDTKLIAAHCVHIDEGEIQTLLHHNVGVVHNPTSNLKLASGFAPVNEMINVGLNVGIGTDGPASNNDLDMFEEMRLAAFLAKSVSGDPTALPAIKVVEMATRIGAQAIHLDNITGTLEIGKKADLILVDLTTIHNLPRFKRVPESVYAQIVYTAKSSDVTDLMVNGTWLMRDRNIAIPTIDETTLRQQAQEFAQRIDTFLIEREKSVLSKLVAIGGATEEESFEVQAKARIPDSMPVLEAIQKPEIEILYKRHYHEYDTYFLFNDPQQGTLRYREDEFIDDQGKVSNIRYRLTLIGPVEEYKFPSDVLLSRSRFLAAATHSLRFYREYFIPMDEVFIEKDRQRWRVLFQGTEFYINLDRMDQPDLGFFLEVKSRTWSLRDAEHKAKIATDLIAHLGASANQIESMDYLELVQRI
ncbi:MAG: amidohydrolase family protein [Anaerolineales bacterium]